MKNTVLEIAYNGNHSLRLPIIGDYNQAAPNAAGGTLGVQARRPDQSFERHLGGPRRRPKPLQRAFGPL